jgi:histidinol phosphatase-like enzyme (inositol monophosphatase family)
MDWERELEVCRDAARRAGAIALRHAERGVSAETKADRSPVTVADRECEEAIVGALRGAFPRDGILGEEGARSEAASGRRWIVDPIDGTRDFLRGLPGWSNLVALEVDGEPVVGVCNLPAAGELYWAVRGEGAWVEDANGASRRITTSRVTRKDEAVLCLTAFNNLGKHPFAARSLDFLSGFWAVRSFSGCQDAIHVASGRAEAWIELAAASWDLAPLKVIAEEAGARFFNFDGGSSIHGGNCVICVPALEAEIRTLIAPQPSGGAQRRGSASS